MTDSTFVKNDHKTDNLSSSQECSNSALVEKSLQWKGVCVEPRPAEGAFKDRECVLAERPLSETTGADVRFFGTPGTQIQHIDRQYTDTELDKGEILKSLSITDLLNCIDSTKTSLDPQICDRVPINKLQIPKTNDGKSFINFISMDIEGQERKLLHSFPFEHVQVGVWVIETGGAGTADQGSEVKDILEGHGYRSVPVANAGVDSYFVGAETKYKEALNGKPWRVHPEGSNGC